MNTALYRWVAIVAQMSRASNIGVKQIGDSNGQQLNYRFLDFNEDEASDIISVIIW